MQKGECRMTNNLIITIGRQCGSGGKMIGELLAEKFGGKYSVKVYPSNQLASGNQQTAVEMVQYGDIEMSMFGMTVLSFLDDRLVVVNMPFLINSTEEADRYIYDENAESRKISLRKTA